MRSTSTTPPDGSTSGLLCELRRALRARGYSERTERAYLMWAARLVRDGPPSPGEPLQPQDLGRFLRRLRARPDVGASSYGQALSALRFLCRRVLCWPAIESPTAPARGAVPRSPVVLSRREVQAVLSCLPAGELLVPALIYGSGLRLVECLRLRVADLDFPKRRIRVKGEPGEGRETLLPAAVIPALKDHLREVRVIWHRDSRRRPAAAPPVEPTDLGSRSWPESFVFPAARRRRCSAGLRRRGHRSPREVARAWREAMSRSAVERSVPASALRHAFAVHLLQEGHSLERVRELLGHRHRRSTRVYLGSLQGPIDPRSPLDRLWGSDGLPPPTLRRHYDLS